jgi:hypothetical protein
MAVVVGTSCPGYPTPSDSLMGHQMPSPADEITFALNSVAAILFGVAASTAVLRRRLLAGIVALFTSGVILFFVSVLIWRVTCPASAGNGG